MLASVEADEADRGEGTRECGVGGSTFMVNYSTVIQSVWGSRTLSVERLCVNQSRKENCEKCSIHVEVKTRSKVRALVVKSSVLNIE